MKILAIAATTIREALRRKVQVNLLLFGLFLIVASLTVSSLTLGEMHRIISDLGLSSMELIGTLIAVFLGAGLIAGDVERKIIFAVVAKPVSRSQYLVGRYLGLACVLILNLLVMATALAGVLVYDADSMKPMNEVFLSAVGMLGVQFLVVAAIAVFFSALSSTTLAAIFALSLAAAGHLSNDLRTLSGGAMGSMARALWFALPNLSALTLNDSVIYNAPIGAATWMAVLYAGCYAALMLALAALVFSRRDFR